MKIRKVTVLVLLVIPFLLWNCRKRLEPTEVEMSDYGWELYAQGKYSDARFWFEEAVFEDSVYKDGYNGLGWTHGKLGNIQLSITNFKIARTLVYTDTTDEDLNLLGTGHNVGREVTAGLSMAYHANDEHQKAVAQGTTLLAMTGDSSYTVALGDPNWKFSRDQTVSSKHVIWTLASSQFSLGHFGKSLSRVHQLMSAPTSFEPDTTTVEGRRELAEKIELLRTGL